MSDQNTSDMFDRVVQLNNTAQAQARQLAGRGMMPDQGAMALQRVTMLTEYLLGPVDLEDPGGCTPARLEFEEAWLTHLTRMNERAILTAPPVATGKMPGNGKGGLILP